ncbi:protein kinase domain-containing protein [Spirillospora sp. CA-142024]|uniref:protein kinase domain-containing protein n=1 Tax=Spirillospora sp. CA-142024 TaxID=3240036 RepID=UPI003D8B379B
MKVQLRGHEWELGAPIGQGGFGKVVEARSTGSTDAAAKLVPKTPGAERELLFVDLAGIPNVVPIIDSGDTDEYWVLVMPRAETSLRGYLDANSGTLEIAEAVKVLTDVAAALAGLNTNGIVHRDLKPENVLLLDGHWCIADFGIARYASAATATHTHKWRGSAAYVAPERWREERATIASDVYALGVIGFELLTGNQPFTGPEVHDFREQHLHGEIPELRGIPSNLSALIDECLYKASQTRPSPQNISARLQRQTQEPTNVGLKKLQDANLTEVKRLSEEARTSSQEKSDADRRAEIFAVAEKKFNRIMDALRTAILESAPTVQQIPMRDGSSYLKLGDAELRFPLPVRTPNPPWGGHPGLKFSVIAHSRLSLTFPADIHGYEGRSHSLWFCDAQQEDYYQWFETSFMFGGFSQRNNPQEPFALDPGSESATALGPGITIYQAAWPFEILEIGDLEDFISRWAGWFADASLGRLQHPHMMPERSPRGSWRS